MTATQTIDAETGRGTYHAMIDVLTLLLVVGDRGRPGPGDPEDLKPHTADVDLALALLRAHLYREGVTSTEDERLSVREVQWVVEDLPDEIVVTLREAADLDPELPPVALPGPTAGSPVI